MRKKIIVTAWLLLVIITLTNCRKAEIPKYQIEGKAATYLNVPYGEDLRQMIDVHLPANRTSNTKVIILVHGGSFIGGDKEEVRELAEYIAGYKGFAVINMNYRLVDGTGLLDVPPPHLLSAVKVKNQVDDLAAVVDLTISSAKKWVIDPDKITIAGYSAGGTLGMLYSYNARNTGKVKAVANIAGAVDMTFTDVPDWHLLPAPIAEGAYRYTGVTIDPVNESHFKAISPLHKLNKDKPVPTLNIFPENNDVMGLPKLDLLTYNRFTSKLDELKIANEFFFMSGSDHYFSKEGDWVKVMDKVTAYFNLRVK